MADVNVTFVEKEFSVQADITALTWGDLLKLQKAVAGGVSEDEAQELLAGIISKVTGQDANELPAVAVQAVLNGLLQRVQGNGQAAKN